MPYPLDYGGVIDIFCTIRALHAEGFDIILHCFEYGRGQQSILNQFCKEVHYYQRREGHKGFSFQMPYIVASRSDCSLLERLAADDHPILLEGIHTSYLLHDDRFRNRKVVVRLFNVESRYYHHLYKAERSFFKKAYYLNESRLLHQYEKQLASRATILSLSEQDTHYYKQAYAAKDVHTLPAFLPNDKVRSQEGIGTFCLYHGNLAVAENEKAALWLLEEVFRNLAIPFVVAGKNPSSRLERVAHLQSHTCLVANPDEKEMNDLIAKAQINILPSFNETGVKLKLLNALFNGRHVVVNQASVASTGFEPTCHIAETTAAMQRIIAQLYRLPFGEEEIRLRKKILEPLFDTSVNIRKLIEYLH